MLYVVYGGYYNSNIRRLVDLLFLIIDSCPHSLS